MIGPQVYGDRQFGCGPFSRDCWQNSCAHGESCHFVGPEPDFSTMDVPWTYSAPSALGDLRGKRPPTRRNLFAVVSFAFALVGLVGRNPVQNPMLTVSL
jgi:hypothetical protein